MGDLLRRIGRSPAVFALPGCVFLAAFAAYPLVMTVINSFRKVTVPGLVTGRLPFIGLDNYRQMIESPDFWRATTLTVVFTVVCVAAQFLLGLAMAVLLNNKFRGRGVFRALLMVPWVMPIVVVGATFKWMFQSGNGLVNTVLRAWGLGGVGWLEQPGPAFAAVIIANVWFGFPFAMSNLSAALQTVPVSIMEAAVVDGASSFQRFRAVVLPVIAGPIAILLTLQVIYTFNVFELVLVMTGGGPAGSTTLLTYFTYQLGFEFYDLGPASAATVLMLLALAAFSVLYLRLSSKAGDAL